VAAITELVPKIAIAVVRYSAAAGTRHLIITTFTVSFTIRHATIA
jgi:hypothetical protein